MVIAPDDFPYKKYRNRYCYEHILVYWKHYGEIPDGYIIHHKNDNKHDNRIENLELMSREDHSRHHGVLKGKTLIDIECPYCGNIFSREARQTFLKKPKTLTTCCSRTCSAKFSHLRLSKDERVSIGLLSIIDTYHL